MSVLDCPLSFCVSHVIINQDVSKLKPLYSGSDLRFLMQKRYRYKIGQMTSELAFEYLIENMISRKGNCSISFFFFISYPYVSLILVVISLLHIEFSREEITPNQLYGLFEHYYISI